MAPYQLTTEQVNEYRNQGHTCLTNGLPAGLLSKLQQCADELEARALEAHNQGQSLSSACIVPDPVGERLMRFNDIHLYHAELALELLASPPLMAIARQLCGQGAVPLQMDILYKHQHPHPVVQWHQDAPHPRSHPYVNAGVYLDDAPAGDGCLRCVPGTQHEPVDIDHLSEKYGWEVPGMLEIPAKAGDILVHDVMILHGSQPKRSPGVRRTLYIEFRPFTAITESQSQSDFWTGLRKQWMAQVLEKTDSINWPDDWKQDYPSATSDNQALMQMLIDNREPSIPSIWNINPVISDNYPVPEDMQDW
ncbi:phytanoyl-CoA dioxygenase family protein [Oceanospirillum sediminis]|uniref:Phytanoyl-CoA dioxygenase family protein n=1 Tax=Oceanospirillum sediminis TaxID=2760088 RepID=A0A839ITX4_9GAMM|nr:phytanoyl-CoA dioxygenase family protein [Oceanospirillum sediminis]MBB1488398.1 phytanoyl-CoA dioxygenase family protein [Oceanospirillum sediminis]